MKRLLVSAVLATTLSSTGAWAIGEAAVQTAIKEAAGVAKAAINKNKSSVTVKNSTLDNNVSITKSGNYGNTGISVKADEVLIQNSKLKNKVKIDKSLNVGNAGIELGK